MDAQTWARVRELFDALIEAPIDQRVIRLDALLATDLGALIGNKDAIRAEVLAMLAADAQDLLKTSRIVISAPAVFR